MGAITSKYNGAEGDSHPSSRNPLEISVGEIEHIENANDPRSPTPYVSRTPLESQEAVASKITKNVDLTKECFEKYCNNMPVNPAFRNVLNEIDPRSPTLDFKRTPLAVLIKNPQLMAIYNQMNTSDFLNNTDTVSNDLDVSKIEADAQLVPKSLESDLQNMSLNRSQDIQINAVEPLTINIQEDIISNVQNQLEETEGPIIGLLETNLDYVETDLDAVQRQRRRSRCSRRDETNKIIHVIKDLSKKDPRSPSLGVDRTPIVSVQPASQDKTPVYTVAKIEIKEIFENNLALQKKMNETPKVPDGDSLLIYEDIPTVEAKNTPVIRVNANKLKNVTPRTPLASVINVGKPNLKNSHSNPTDSKKVKSKIPIKVKHSPRFLAVRNSLTPKSALIKKNRKIAIETVENTPPKVRHARWDQDNSVIV